jgi:Ca2+-dependent lipid-binding protein
MLSNFLSGPVSQGKVLLDGCLLRQGGLFKDWSKRFCELTEDTLICYSSKGGTRLSHFSLSLTTQYLDSNQRHFCFSLTDQATGDSVYYACDTSAAKEHWKECIVTQLSVIQKSHNRKARMNFDKKESEQIRNDYLLRPMIYIKIIQARNLTAKDIGGLSDPFVEVTVGQSKEKTITRKKTLNPEWGMVFKFDWSSKDRYAKIDVW